MRHVERTDSRFGFFRPFFETGRGQIFGLATRIDHLRDGLAVALLARFFPLPEFDGISLEPGRPTIQPLENIILVGSSQLFAWPDAHRISGPEPPLSLGEANLGDRLRRIYDQCCFRLTPNENRVVRNAVTGVVYRPERNEAKDVEIDYGVIRRLFRGPVENTITVEGLHGLGTLGAAKVATSQLCLDAIWNAVRQIPDFDESLPLEVLVRCAFQPKLSHHVYALDAIKAVPLLLVYNRRLACEMTEMVRWKDQLPWDLHLCMSDEDDPSEIQPQAKTVPPLPRLEISGELRGIDRRVASMARRVWAGAGRRGRAPAGGEQRLLLELLTAASDRFRIELMDEVPWGTVKVWRLPRGRATASRGLRKQFFLHLALCRAMGLGFQCDDASIRRFFPKYSGGASTKPPVDHFIGSVPGKLRDCFEPLLGSTRDRKHYVQIDYRRKGKTYRLRLERAALVLKLRF